MKNNIVYFLGALWFGGLCLSTSSQAQTVDIPSAADAGRVAPQLPSFSLPMDHQEVDVRSAPVSVAPDGADAIRFTLSQVTFEGATLYTQEQLQTSFHALLGQDVSLADIYAAAAALTVTYRNDGYVLTRVIVPAQTIDDGALRLRVVEGFIDDVSFQNDDTAPLPDGMRLKIETLARGYLRHALEQRPSHIHTLERALLLLNDLPGIAARSVLAPSPTVTGAARLTIMLSYTRFDGMGVVDNYGSRYLGPVQLSHLTQINTPFGYGEQIEVQAVYAPGQEGGRELAYGAAQLRVPIGRQGTVIEFGGSYSDTEPGYILNDLDVEGSATRLHIGASHPFYRGRDFTLNGNIKLDFADIRSDNAFDTERKDDVRMLRLGADVDWADRLFSMPALSRGHIEISQGIDVLGGSEAGDFFLTRPDAEPHATLFSASFHRLQSLTRHWAFSTQLRGQYSDDAFLSLEEFGVGGAEIGRGYSPSEIIGDQGAAAAFEAQYMSDVRFIGSNPVQFFAFYDVGRVWNLDAADAAAKKDTLTSAGGGFRIDWPHNISGEVFLAQPLNRDVETQNDRDGRVFFRLNYRY